MADYKRLVSYMYNYESGIKGNNVGYGRVESINGQCKITIRIQIPSINNEELRVFFFIRKGYSIEGIPLGVVTIRNGRGQFRTITDSNNIMGSSYELNDIGGIVLYYSDKRYIASEWDDKPITKEMVNGSLLIPQKSEVNDEENLKVASGIDKKIKKDSESKQVRKDKDEEAEWKEKVNKNREVEEEVKVEKNRELVEEEKADKVEGAEEVKADKIEEVEEVKADKIEGVEEVKVDKGEEAEENKVDKHEDIEEEADKNKETEKVEELVKTADNDEDKEKDNTRNNKLMSFNEDSVKEVKAKLTHEKLKSIDKIGLEQRKSNEAYRKTAKTVYAYRPRESSTLSKSESVEDLEADSNLAEKLDRVDKNDELEDELETNLMISNKGINQEIEKAKIAEAAKQKNPSQYESNMSNQSPYSRKKRKPWPAFEENHEALKIYNKYPRMYPFEDNEVAWCVRFEPQDIGVLPLENWSLGNNSFLLHGFYCYSHLIFARINDKAGIQYVLGVPGIYHNREKFMARMFGFDHFKSIKRKELRTGEFGYWYTPIIFN